VFVLVTSSHEALLLAGSVLVLGVVVFGARELLRK
jgi:hypothetical protein